MSLIPMANLDVTPDLIRGLPAFVVQGQKAGGCRVKPGMTKQP